MAMGAASVQSPVPMTRAVPPDGTVNEIDPTDAAAGVAAKDCRRTCLNAADGPAGPVSPGAPWGPCGPSGPGGPCRPWGPWGPWGPCPPGAPAAPGAPLQTNCGSAPSSGCASESSSVSLTPPNVPQPFPSSGAIVTLNPCGPCGPWTPGVPGTPCEP